MTKRTATLLTIVPPIPEMMREFKRTEKDMNIFRSRGNPHDIAHAAKIFDEMRQNLIAVAKSPFTQNNNG